MTGGTDTLLILHCHIPKTAGTSISGGLRNAFENFHFHHYHPDPFYILTPQILEDLLRIDPALRSISSHHLRSFPLSIAGRPTFLFTFLRKPEDVFISQLKHAQRQFSEFPEPVRRLWPKETPRMPLRELAWQYLELATAHQDFCPQTRFFGNPDAMARLGLSDGNRYGFESCEIARSILSDFHFVGIVDQMKKSLDVLTHLLMDRGIKVYFDLRLKLNCCPDPARPAWLNVEDVRLADAFSRPVRVIAFSIAIFGGCFLDRIESFGNAVGWALDQRSRMHGSHSAAVAGAARPNRWLIPDGCSALATG